MYKPHLFAADKISKVGGAVYTWIQAYDRREIGSYGAECYRHSFLMLKTNTRHLFLASYGAECSRHSFPTLTLDKHQTFIFSVIRSRMFPPFISDAKEKHPTFIFSVIRSRMFPPFISDAKDKHPTFIFSKKRIKISFFFRFQKLGVRFIHGCGLYTVTYGNCYRIQFNS